MSHAPLATRGPVPEIDRIAGEEVELVTDRERERIGRVVDADERELLARTREVTGRIRARGRDVTALPIGEAVGVDAVEHLPRLDGERALGRDAAQVRAAHVTHREVGLVGDRRLPTVHDVVTEAQQRVDGLVVALDGLVVSRRDLVAVAIRSASHGR